MILYHGSDQIIEFPEIRVSSRTLDFGQGFYTTTNKEQAVEGKKYDIIYGPVANDTIYRTLIVYETGEFSKSDIIARLKVRQLYDQMTFTSSQSLTFLTYTGFMEVSNG